MAGVSSGQKAEGGREGVAGGKEFWLTRTVMGALCRKTDPKIVTYPRLKVEARIKIKIKIIQSRIKRWNLVSLSLEASHNKFSRGSLVIRIGCLSL